MGAVLYQSLWGLLAGLALATALATVLAANPLRGALSLLLHIITLSLLFVMLHASGLAVLNVLVYGGATVVLFVFVIMLLGPRGAQLKQGPIAPIRSAAAWFVAGAGLLAWVAITAGSVAHGLPFPELAACSGGVDCFGSVQALAPAIFKDSWLLFECVGLLLTTAIVSALAIARTHGWHQRHQADSPAVSVSNVSESSASPSENDAMATTLAA